jgi:hypothetical protein
MRLSGTRFWPAALLVFAVFSLLEGFGLVVGYLLVTVPGEAEQQLSDQRAPLWVLLVGLALTTFGAGVVGIATYLARRRGRPVWNLDRSARPAILRLEPLSEATTAVAIALPLVLVTTVATNSKLRFYPLALAVGIILLILWRSLANRSSADE